VIAYVFWHSPAAGVAEGEYEGALALFFRQLSGSGIPGLRQCRSIRFEQLPWVAGRPVYQDWYELEDTAALDSLEAGAVRAAMEAPHAAITRLAGVGMGGLFASRSEPDRHPLEPLAEPRIAWVDKPAGMAYGPFVSGLMTAVEPGGALWQRRLSLGPAREFCLWLPGDRLSSREVPATDLPPGSLVVRGAVVASSAV
jgi:hypothetical protein